MAAFFFSLEKLTRKCDHFVTIFSKQTQENALASAAGDEKSPG